MKVIRRLYDLSWGDLVDSYVFLFDKLCILLQTIFFVTPDFPFAFVLLIAVKVIKGGSTFQNWIGIHAKYSIYWAGYSHHG